MSDLTTPCLSRPTRLLFICSRNRLRSPTGEAIYQAVPGFETASAGTAPDAEELVCADSIEWADVVICMEGRHKKALVRAHPKAMKDKRTVVLGIPDDFDCMQPELVDILHRRADALLGIDSLSLLAAKSVNPRTPKP